MTPTPRVARAARGVRPAIGLTTVALAAMLGACSSGPSDPGAPTRLAPATGAALQACEALAARFSHPGTSLQSAATAAPGPIVAGGPAAGAHCLVKGQMRPRKGVDGQDYAIGFEVRLPQAWNGRYFHQANGGIDGVVQPAQGALGGGPVTGALAQGFAVLSSDAGHTGRQNPRFGVDPQARADYGYQATAALTPMAKALIAAAYGKGPDRSYIGGCSNGGRHTLVAAARYGDQFDGYLVGAPGFRLPNAALAQLWAAPQWKALATPGATIPHPFNPQARITDLGSALTAPERQAVARGILQRCDALDGARDGIVADTAACQAAFNLERDVPTCSGERNGQCLTAPQKRLLNAVYAGGRTPGGQAIYSPFPWDAGLSSANWAQWKFVNAQVLDPAAGYIFMTPPRTVDPFAVDVDDAYRAIYATDATFRESADAQITMPGKENPTNLATLRTRGAKMLVYHGVSDAIFSAADTVALMERLDRAQGGRAADFARYFPVPGMAHCQGGPATDQFDALTPLVRWVEYGEAPEGLPARARGPGSAGGVNAEVPADWAPGRTRTLCRWPAVSRYKGSGSVDDAASYTCAP
ncbi:MAG: tannase/feruloyl esterase family alpha/beta hydrolase [Rubrivivax sp.]|jgi:feruloyl esterase|nr:tannase/feruloyl esterase family alpha/beta hydrolase [Rubrivivax sp.]